MQRRTFLKSILPAAAAARHLAAQTDQPWGGPVLDTHLHLRANADACFTHMQGCGVTNAVLLTRAQDQDRATAEMERRPGHFAHPWRPIRPRQMDKVLRDTIKGGRRHRG
jgi:hypothetical protein